MIAYNKNNIKALIESKLIGCFGKETCEAKPVQVFKACALIIRDILMEKWQASKALSEKNGQKQVYYLSMEFLTGRLLINNMVSLGVKNEFEAALELLGFELTAIAESEPDPALGNGGLGRLAACYLDSMAALGIVASGFSIRYEYGIFKQKIIDGNQAEMADVWLDIGEVWQMPVADEAEVIRFGGSIYERWVDGRPRYEQVNAYNVLAVPYDVPIAGYGSGLVNTLRLWQATIPDSFDMELFNRGEFLKADEQKAMAEIISKVLYPEDRHPEGKSLRLKQQYFFVSATIQSIIRKHKRLYSIYTLPQKAAIQLNDTHPSLAIPELMRILMDVEGLNWQEAWDITTKTISYTNHTIMTEALERWSEDLFKTLLPRIYMIVKEINERFCRDLWSMYPGDWNRVSDMAVTAYNEVRMANLCLCACHRINGVSKLHSTILKDSVFNNFYKIWPEKFENVTNGITHRRWLLNANPLLAGLITSAIGDGWIKDLSQLERLKPFSDNKVFRDEFYKVKQRNKKELAEFIMDKTGIKTDTLAIFDVQVKRLHEYKRQMLNLLNIISLYNSLLENPEQDITPRVFIFAAKAAPGYYIAKKIIKLICSVASTINSNPLVRDKLKVVFLEDYRVTLAERIIPAANISEQISVAGKEASGTGNMKLMLNGAITIGTLDGANIEIYEQVGKDNIYIFGLTENEVLKQYREGYIPYHIYNSNPVLKAAVDMIRSGCFDKDTSFDDVCNCLLYSDSYMVFADFDSYQRAQSRIDRAYRDEVCWNRMGILNVAGAGIFTSDRSILEYAERIWQVKSMLLT